MIVRRLLGGTGTPSADGAALGVPDTLSWRDVFQSSRSLVGKQVSPETALGIPSVWGAMRILTDAIGSMPLISYSRDGASRSEAYGDPTYRLLRYRPNPEMTATHLWRQVMFHLNSWGNAYLSKQFTGGRVTALWPVEPKRVRVQRRGGVKEFWVADTFWNWKGPYTSAEMIHVQGISFDSLLGISPIEAAREAIGLGLALDEYTNRFFSQGAVPRVVLKTDQQLDEGAAARLAADWRSKYGGLSNAHATAVLEQGLDAKVLSFPMRDLQFVEQMQWSAADIARIFRLPASKLNVSTGDSMTYRTAETETLDLLGCVQGWLVLIEDALSGDPDLFSEQSARQGSFCEFNADAILRVDAKTRADYYARATGGKPWMRGSEVRPAERLPPDDTIDELPADTHPNLPGDQTSP